MGHRRSRRRANSKDGVPTEREREGEGKHGEIQRVEEEDQGGEGCSR